MVRCFSRLLQTRIPAVFGDLQYRCDDYADQSFSGNGTDNISDLQVVGTQVFFTVEDSRGRELWKSDGTSAGTVLVRDIAPGAASSDPTQFAVAGGLLYFNANGPSGKELWRSNGTAAGTIQVRDINPGSAGSNPFRLRAIGSTIYFVANDGTSGYELWRSNGSSAGTTRVKDFAPGSSGSINIFSERGTASGRW